MIQHILMPKLGETMTEATVERWHKTEGDPIRKGDVILEITTDKATLEVESSIAGVMRKILAPEKATLPVNTVIALAGEPNDPLPADLEALMALARGEQPAAAAAEKPKPALAAASAHAAGEPAAPPAPPGELFASPRARMRAREAKVPLQILRGSGPNGRIVEKDVLAHV